MYSEIILLDKESIEGVHLFCVVIWWEKSLVLLHAVRDRRRNAVSYPRFEGQKMMTEEQIKEGEEKIWAWRKNYSQVSTEERSVWLVNKAREAIWLHMPSKSWYRYQAGIRTWTIVWQQQYWNWETAIRAMSWIPLYKFITMCNWPNVQSTIFW